MWSQILRETNRGVNIVGTKLWKGFWYHEVCGGKCGNAAAEKKNVADFTLCKRNLCRLGAGKSKMLRLLVFQTDPSP